MVVHRVRGYPVRNRRGCPRDQSQSCVPCESMVVEWAVNYAYERGVVVIDAAGNENQSTVGYPAANDRAVVVEAVNNSDVRVDFSNYNAGVTVDEIIAIVEDSSSNID